MKIDEGNEPMTLETHEQGRGRTRVALGAAIVTACLMLGACSDDGEASGQDERSSTTESTEDSTSTTQPPGTDLDAVEPIIEELLVRLDEVSTEILGDPAAVVNDPESPAMAEFAEIFAEGEAYEARLSTYQSNAASGLTVEPLNATSVTTTRIAGELTTIDEVTVEGPVCIVNTYRMASPGGGETKDGLAHPGHVRAIQVEGEWKLQQIDVDDSRACDPEASA